jgi:plasmid stabilization system protein ParE
VTRYVLSPEAKEDLRDIRGYLVSQGGKRVARYVLREITAAFRLLASHPEAGSPGSARMGCGQFRAGLPVVWKAAANISG